MEVDGVRKAFLVAEAAAACLDRLDPAVDAFGGSVGRTRDHGVDDAPEVFTDHAGGLDDRVQAAARRPVEPPVPSGDRPGPALVAPEVRRRFLQLPSLGRPPRAGAQPGERQLLTVRLSPAALQPLVLRPREDFVSLLHERPVLRAPYLVHRVAQVLGHMEPIERDLLQRFRNHLQRGRDVRAPHVHGDTLDRGAAGLPQTLVKRLQRLFSAPLCHIQHDPLLRIRHHGHVLVAPAKGRLVHRQVPHRPLRAARQPPRHGPLHDAVRRVRAQPHPLRHRLHARLLQPPDRFRLELCRIPRTPLRPRHLHRHPPCSRHRIRGTSQTRKVE